MALEQDVKHIISEQLGVPESAMTKNAKFTDDLGADSLDTVEMVMALEEKFEIEISDQDAEKVQTVGAAISLIKEKTGSTSTPEHDD